MEINTLEITSSIDEQKPWIKGNVRDGRCMKLCLKLHFYSQNLKHEVIQQIAQKFLILPQRQ